VPHLGLVLGLPPLAMSGAFRATVSSEAWKVVPQEVFPPSWL